MDRDALWGCCYFESLDSFLPWLVSISNVPSIIKACFTCPCWNIAYAAAKQEILLLRCSLYSASKWGRIRSTCTCTCQKKKGGRPHAVFDLVARVLSQRMDRPRIWTSFTHEPATPAVQQSTLTTKPGGRYCPEHSAAAHWPCISYPVDKKPLDSFCSIGGEIQARSHLSHWVTLPFCLSTQDLSPARVASTSLSHPSICLVCFLLALVASFSWLTRVRASRGGLEEFLGKV